MKNRTFTQWTHADVFIGLFSICLSLSSFALMQRNEKSNMDLAVDSIQSLAYPPSLVAGAKLVDHRNRTDGI